MGYIGVRERGERRGESEGVPVGPCRERERGREKEVWDSSGSGAERERDFAKSRVLSFEADSTAACKCGADLHVGVVYNGWLASVVFKRRVVLQWIEGLGRDAQCEVGGVASWDLHDAGWSDVFEVRNV